MASHPFRHCEPKAPRQRSGQAAQSATSCHCEPKAKQSVVRSRGASGIASADFVGLAMTSEGSRSLAMTHPVFFVNQETTRIRGDRRMSDEVFEKDGTGAVAGRCA